MSFAEQEATLETSAGFDFTQHMRRLAVDVSERLDELRHIRMERVAIRICQTRAAGQHGMQASLTPLRFEEGRLTTRRRGQTWRIDPLVDADGREILYLLSFYLPRFMNLTWREKVNVVVHELWHIGPRFDGDVRRHGHRCYAHGPRQRQYDAVVQRLADRYLALDPPAELHEFLRYSFRELQRQRGPIYGFRIPTPRLRRVE